MAIDYQDQSASTNSTSTINRTNGRSRSWLWIILAVIAVVGAYATYHANPGMVTTSVNSASPNTTEVTSGTNAATTDSKVNPVTTNQNNR